MTKNNFMYLSIRQKLNSILKFVKVPKQRKLLLLDCLIVIGAFFYYQYFVNKGLNFSDEGYYVHFAQRLANGEIPYKDLALQYTPGYFYLLASLYKLFGFQILVGRYLSIAFCIMILITFFSLLILYRLKSSLFHILTGLIVITLGYPLLYLPIVVWACVFFALILQILFILWHRNPQNRYILFIGIMLGLMTFFKQNLGAYYILLFNLLVFLSTKLELMKKVKLLLLMNFYCLIFLFFAFLVIFKNVSNFSSLRVLFLYSAQFTETYKFTYPALSMIFEFFGFFKLLPYYFPIVYLVIIVWFSLIKKITIERSSFAFTALTGFFGTVYPASDLLHVYPFLSMVIVSSLVTFYKHKRFIILIIISCIFVLLGIYLTFFKRSYRYDDYFFKDKTPLILPNTKGIVINSDNSMDSDLPILYSFISKHTKKDDYIFVYPFEPLLYFVLDRPNPSGIVQFIILEAPNSVYPEKRVLSEIKQKNVQYIITAGPYNYNQPISKFIQMQKKVFQTGSYKVFRIGR